MTFMMISSWKKPFGCDGFFYKFIQRFNPLTAKLFNLNFHPLEVVDRVTLDAIHNFKWVKIIQIWQNGGQLFSNLAGWCHIFFELI